VKAYSYLGQAQLKLGHPNEALTSSLQAYELAISQRSPSVSSIAATCLEAKKKRWELQEDRRRKRECHLLKHMSELIEHESERELDLLLLVQNPSGDWDRIEEIRNAAREQVKTLEDVFGKAEAERCGRREVPDYLIDNISFSVMLDPVIVCLTLSQTSRVGLCC
jgi:hypothetical protein